jgi:anti-sigma factor RsiW
MNPDDRAHQHDINAYLDGELDPTAARAVELYLAEHPDQAAAAMADMAIMHGLRSAAAVSEPPSPRVLKAAKRLQGSFRTRSVSRRFAAAAVLTLVYLGGWATAELTPAGAAGLFQRAPEFVDEALMSHRTAILRARMNSQPEVTTIDRREIRAATKIALPSLPAAWRLTDAQVYPSDEGPSLGLAFRSPTGPVSLFVFHAQGARSIEPTVVQRGAAYVSYWRSKDLAFVLIGPSDPHQLRQLATMVATNDGAIRDL